MRTRLTLADARRIAVRAQLLDAQRPADLLQVVDRLTMLQLDPTAAIAPNADLVAYTRLGSSYRPEHLVQAVERDRTLFEHRGQVVEAEPIVVNIRPMASLPLHLADAEHGARAGFTQPALAALGHLGGDGLPALARCGQRSALPPVVDAQGREVRGAPLHQVASGSCGSRRCPRRMRLSTQNSGPDSA